jgi:hypothetical protein
LINNYIKSERIIYIVIYIFKVMKGFAVQPKLDCPHLSQAKVQELSEYLLNINTKHFSEFECASCGDKSENWVCL